jgi:hypothetical protein
MDKMDDEMKNQFDALAILWKGAWEQFNERILLDIFKNRMIFCG